MYVSFSTILYIYIYEEVDLKSRYIAFVTHILHEENKG